MKSIILLIKLNLVLLATLILAPAGSVAADPVNHAREFLKGGQFPKITAGQLKDYLQTHQRNAKSLLAAFLATGDHTLLGEAMQKYPDNPRVDYAALFFEQLSPDKARVWAEHFKRSDPKNSMAFYASAMHYLKSGQPSLAFRDMSAAAKLTWTDYSTNFVHDCEDVYRAAGYSEVDTLVAAEMRLLLPDLAQIKQLSLDLATVTATYEKNGNSTRAKGVIQMNLLMGEQVAASKIQPPIATLVGYAVQITALSAMDPNSPSDAPGKTVRERIDQLREQRKYVDDMTSGSVNLFLQMSDDDLLAYLKRSRASGPLSALEWGKAKYSGQ